MVMKDRDTTFRGLIEGAGAAVTNANFLENGQSYEDLKQFNIEFQKRNNELQKQIKIMQQEV